jgi:Tol biopolymer transport system component
VVAAFLVAPAPSHATLVFTRNPSSPIVLVANDNGSAARKLGAGSNPRVSPDGQTVVFYRVGKGNQPAELMLAAASGGAVKKLASGWQDPFVFAWSADSARIAVLLGPETGKQRLTIIDVASGTAQQIASG